VGNVKQPSSPKKEGEKEGVSQTYIKRAGENAAMFITGIKTRNFAQQSTGTLDKPLKKKKGSREIPREKKPPKEVLGKADFPSPGSTQEEGKECLPTRGKKPENIRPEGSTTT